MSLAAIQAEARDIATQALLEPSAVRDVLTALAENGTDTPPFLFTLGREAGLDPRVALARATGVHLNIVALQVMDDVADGDCDYLTPAAGAGTATQYMLQNLGYAALLDAGLPPELLRTLALELAGGASAQSLEVRTRVFDPASARVMTEGFGGRHYAAYFRLMLHGTRLEARAAELGRALGIGVAVSSDIRSHDARVMTLLPEERAELIAWALAETAQGSGTSLRTLDALLGRIDTHLLGAFALLTGPGDAETATADSNGARNAPT